MSRGKGDDGSGSGLFPVAGFRKRRGRRKDRSGSEVQETGGSCLPSPGDALDGGRPLLIVHKPYRHHDQMPQLLAQLQADTAGNLALGISSLLPSTDADTHRSYNSSCQAAEVRIADPKGYQADGHDLRVKKPTDEATGRAPYLRDGAFPAASLLDAQRDCGANLLLTSGRALNPSDALSSLVAARAEWDEALSLLKPGERLAINVTVSAEWLKQPKLLDDMLAELIEDQKCDVWHVRVQWPPPAKSWHQLTDDKLLAGYRTLAQTAHDERRRLLLPQTGLTGWLALAWGSAGYGTGTYGSNQAFLEESEGGGAGNNKLERYFERQLLHFVERTSRQVLKRDPAYRECACPYCGPLLGGASWSEKNSGLHYLHAVGTLTAEVAPPGAARRQVRDAVVDKVRAAALFAKDKHLTGHSAPAHLKTWDRVLSS